MKYAATARRNARPLLVAYLALVASEALADTFVLPTIANGVALSTYCSSFEYGMIDQIGFRLDRTLVTDFYTAAVNNHLKSNGKEGLSYRVPIDIFQCGATILLTPMVNSSDPVCEAMWIAEADLFSEWNSRARGIAGDLENGARPYLLICAKKGYSYGAVQSGEQ